MIGGGIEPEAAGYVPPRNSRVVIGDIETENRILSRKVANLETRMAKMGDCFTKEATPEQKLKCLEEAFEQQKVVQEPPKKSEAEQQAEMQKYRLWSELIDKAEKSGETRFTSFFKDNEVLAKKRAEELTKTLGYPFEAQLAESIPLVRDNWEVWPVYPK